MIIAKTSTTSTTTTTKTTHTNLTPEAMAKLIASKCGLRSTVMDGKATETDSSQPFDLHDWLMYEYN